MTIVRTLALLVTLAGAPLAVADTARAKTPSKAPTDRQTTAPDLASDDVKRAEAFLNDFYDAVVKNQSECPKMGVAIHAVLDKHLAMLKKLVESGREMPRAVKDRFEAKQKEMMAGVLKCKDDNGVRSAMQRWFEIASAKPSSK
jgi:CRISPR/Cas system-associated exonuclease Cas4 (RecB family)